VEFCGGLCVAVNSKIPNPLHVSGGEVNKQADSSIVGPFTLADPLLRCRAGTTSRPCTT